MIARSFCWKCHGYKVADTRSGTITLPEKCQARGRDGCGHCFAEDKKADGDPDPQFDRA